MREWRRKNSPSEEQRFKDNVRVKAYHAIRSGLLIRKPCEICGEKKVEGHHDDYNKPFEVRWLCGHHHREHHMMERKSNATNNENSK